MDTYTTSEKLAAIDVKDAVKLQEEQKKIIISNDAFAVVDLIEKLINKLEHARLSLM